MNDHNTPLVPFQFETATIRIISQEDGSWSVVAKDVAESLGYVWQPAVVKHVPDEWKGIIPINTPGGTQEMLTLTSQGLYFFLGRSDKPKALPFQKWIAGDVLPSIEKTGSYSLPSKAVPITKQSIIETSLVTREVARALRASGLKGNALTLAADNVAKMTTGVSLLSMAGMTHLVANEQGRTYSPTELGKMCSPTLSGQKFNLLMEAAGLQTKEYGNWMPTDAADGLFEWLDTNKRHSNGTPVKQLRWFRTVLDRLNIGGQKEAA